MRRTTIYSGTSAIGTTIWSTNLLLITPLLKLIGEHFDKSDPLASLPRCTVWQLR
jgi:hypothetical protein